MQPACNGHCTPQAWLLRTEKESPEAPPMLPAPAQELKGLGSRGGTGEGLGCQDRGSQVAMDDLPVTN